MIKEEKVQFIKDFISKELDVLYKDLEDKSLYKKNIHPEKMSIIKNIEEGSND
jgi:hypothetical protein